MSEVKKAYWKRGYRNKLDPGTAFAALEKIKDKNSGVLTAGLVVLEAEKPRHVLHKSFEWIDSIAADEYRLEQARRLLRSIEVVYKDTPHIPPTRGYVTVTEEASNDQPERKVYRTTAEALEDPIARDEVLGNAIRDAISFRRKYAALSELAEVFAAIDSTIDQMKVG